MSVNTLSSATVAKLRGCDEFVLRPVVDGKRRLYNQLMAMITEIETNLPTDKPVTPVCMTPLMFLCAFFDSNDLCPRYYIDLLAWYGVNKTKFEHLWAISARKRNKLKHSENGNIASIFFFKFVMLYLLTNTKYFMDPASQIDLVLTSKRALRNANNGLKITVEVPGMVVHAIEYRDETMRAMFIKLPGATTACEAYRLLCPHL